MKSPSSLPRTATTAGVWLVFVAMLIAAALYVARYSPSIPLSDDLSLVSRATGRQPFTWAWLWKLYNDHRVVAVRLVLLPLMRVSDCDGRYAMFLNVALLAGAVALQLVALRRIRGSSSWIDACLPLVWLSWSNHENLLFAWGLQMILSAVLVGTITAAIAVRPEALGRGRVALVGACCLLLPLTGSQGFLSALPLVAYLLVLGAARSRGGDVTTRRTARLALVLGTAAGLSLGAYLIGFHLAREQSMTLDLARTARTALQFVTLEFGLVGRMNWPWSAAATVVVVLATGARLIASIRGDPRERWRAAGLLACLSSVLGLAVGLALGRAGLRDDAGFAPRYVPLQFPLVSIVLMSWVALGPRLVERALGALLVLVAAWALDVNRAPAIASGEKRQAIEASIREHVRAGWSSWRLAAAHVGPNVLQPVDWLAREFNNLRLTRMGPFRELTWSDEVEQEWILPCHMFATQPSLVTPASAVVIRQVGTRSVLALLRDAKIVFDLPPGAHQIAGELGWVGDEGEGRRPSGFVEFRARHVAADGTATSLWERRLDLTSASAPIFEPFSVALPAEAAGELELLVLIQQNAAAPVGTPFWTAVEIR